MIGLDTNVLVRFLVRDDEVQFERAQKLVRRESNGDDPAFLSHLVLLETEWVLRSQYKLTQDEIHDVFSGLLSSNNLRVEEESSVEEALYVWKNSGAQFADCLIGAHNRASHCASTATFDTVALRLRGFSAV